MKEIGIILASNLVALALVGLAGYMMHIGKKGAGWVILAAMLTSATVSFKNKDPEKPLTVE